MGLHKGLVGQSEGGASVKQDKTLKDYIQRKTENMGELGISKSMAKRLAAQTKLTFNEWYTKDIRISLDRLQMRKDGGRAAAELIWNAAKENM